MDTLTHSQGYSSSSQGLLTFNDIILDATCFQDHQSVEVAKTFLKEGGLLNEVSKLACKGTRLSTKWLASDLEVCILIFWCN